MEIEAKTAAIYSILGALSGFAAGKYDASVIVFISAVSLLLPMYIIESIEAGKDAKYAKKTTEWWAGNAFIPYIFVLFAVWVIAINI